MIRMAAPFALAAALCFTGVSAMAEGNQDRGTKEEQDACTPDVYRLCASMIPDEKRIVACLKQNKAKLNPACRKVFS